MTFGNEVIPTYGPSYIPMTGGYNLCATVFNTGPNIQLVDRLVARMTAWNKAGTPAHVRGVIYDFATNELVAYTGEFILLPDGTQNYKTYELPLAYDRDGNPLTLPLQLPANQNFVLGIQADEISVWQVNDAMGMFSTTGPSPATYPSRTIIDAYIDGPALILDWAGSNQVNALFCIYATAAAFPDWYLSVSATYGGTTQTGFYTYPYGVASATFTATPNVNYQFDGWTLDGISQGTGAIAIGPYTDGSTHTLIANFSPVAPTPDWVLNVLVTAGGTTIPAPGIHTYPYNTLSDVFTAQAYTNYQFDGWTLDGVAQGTTPITVGPYTNGSTHTLIANFSPIIIETPPTANFTFSVSNRDVTFTDTSDPGTSPITSWLWDFGDGTTSTQQNPTHTYAADGTYPVTLIVATAVPPANSITQNVTVIGAAQEITITVQTGQGGSVNPAGPLSIPIGLIDLNATFNPTPAPGYVFDHWELNGTAIISPYTFTAFDSGAMLTAIFRETTAPPPPPPPNNLLLLGLGATVVGGVILLASDRGKKTRR